uniref:Uncharacterized protein n=1 Tax=Anopheles quadriannulatus TaxID=34691 RepID=A0A182X1R4_ANOQN
MIQGETYKFLGFLQLRGIHYAAIKKELQDKFLHRVSCILKSFLSAGNKVKAINTFAVALLTYSFGVMKWSNTDLERTIRVVSTKHQNASPKSIHQLRSYFVESQNRHELYRTVYKADHGLGALHLAQQDYQLNCNIKTVDEKVATKKRATIDIDIAVTLDQNVQTTFSTKVMKYHDLAEELKQTWYLEDIRIVPVVISATGIVPMALLRSLDELELQRELPRIQKAVILRTCSILRRFLNPHN